MEDEKLYVIQNSQSGGEIKKGPGNFHAIGQVEGRCKEPVICDDVIERVI